MQVFHADVPTEHASRYLQQLCKHWSHRFQVEFDPTSGVVHMTGAECRFAAEPDRLRLTLEGDAAERLCAVVADHLKRFAFREDLDIRWS